VKGATVCTLAAFVGLTQPDDSNAAKAAPM